VEWKKLQNEVYWYMHYINIHDRDKAGKLEWETEHA
jgi:hypothetical protein